VLEITIAAMIAGLGVYAYFNFVDHRLAVFLRHIWMAHYAAVQQIEQTRGYVAGITLHIQKLSVEQLNVLTMFMAIASNAHHDNLAGIYRESLKSPWMKFTMSGFRDHLEFKIEESRNTFEMAYPQYREQSSYFEQERQLLQPVIGLVEAYEKRLQEEHEKAKT
jgi:hypothetical protein